jgi:hypothetical protein
VPTLSNSSEVENLSSWERRCAHGLHNKAREPKLKDLVASESYWPYWQSQLGSKGASMVVGPATFLLFPANGKRDGCGPGAAHPERLQFPSRTARQRTD